MSKTYYMVINEEQAGPFTFEELKTKNLSAQTLVWAEGMPDWVPAAEVPELEPLLQTTETAGGNNAPPASDAYFGYVLASLGERFMAALLNGIIIFIPLYVVQRMDFFERMNDTMPLASFFSGALGAAVAGAIFYPMWSGNIGHRIMGLKVISAQTGQDMNDASDGALREGLKSVFGNFIVPSIWLLWDKDRQNLYEKVVKTYVVIK